MRAVGMGVENFSRLPRHFPFHNDVDGTMAGVGADIIRPKGSSWYEP